MSEPLTPSSITNLLIGIGRDVDAKQVELAQLDEVHVRSRAVFKVAYAKSFLRTEGSMDVRKYAADLECADLLLEAELAEQVLRACRESLRVLRDRLDIGRSLNATHRAEWGGS